MESLNTDGGVVIASITFAVGLASQRKMEFDGDYHALFSESNPEFEAFDALEENIRIVTIY